MTTSKTSPSDPPAERRTPLDEQRCPACHSEWWMYTGRVPGEARCWEPDCEHVWTVNDGD